MKNLAIVGVLLVLLGVIALVYQGITYTSRETVLDIGPLHATAERQKTLPLPPVLGGSRGGGRRGAARLRACASLPAPDSGETRKTRVETITAFAVAVFGATALTSCARDLQAMDAQQIEQKYGVSGAFASTIATDGGPMAGTLVPITLASGRQAQLFIPQRQASDVQAVYIRDEQGCIRWNSATARAATRWSAPRGSWRHARRPGARAAGRGRRKS